MGFYGVPQWCVYVYIFIKLHITAQSGPVTLAIPVCVCCVAISFILDVRLVDAPAGVTQEEGHTGFPHLPSAVFALIFLARRIQPSLSLVDREVEFCVPTK